MALTNREKLMQLQEAMAEDQTQAAIQLYEQLDGKQVGTFLEKLDNLQERSIPGGYLDQGINHIRTVLTAVRTQLGQHTAQARNPAPVIEQPDLEA